MRRFSKCTGVFLILALLLGTCVAFASAEETVTMRFGQLGAGSTSYVALYSADNAMLFIGVPAANGTISVPASALAAAKTASCFRLDPGGSLKPVEKAIILSPEKNVATSLTPGVSRMQVYVGCTVTPMIYLEPTAPAPIWSTALTYTSSDPTIATVENGVVTGVKKGTAIITVTAVGGASTKITIEVLNGSDPGEHTTPMIPIR